MKHLSPAIAALALGACSWLLGSGPHVPSAYQGTTPVTVVNSSDHELCAFKIFEGNPDNDNWLGDKTKQQNLAPGAKRTFNVKPGVYHVIGGFCDSGQIVAASGTYGNATTSIQGPTLIALGPKAPEPIAGAETRAFAKLYPVGAGGGGAGGAEEPAQEAPAEEPAASSSEAAAEPKAACKGAGQPIGHYSECCSGRATTRGTSHNGGTLVCCTSDQDCVSTP